MPNIADVLKTEIARIARKEIKAETAQFRKASSQYRRQIAALRKQVDALDRALRQKTRTRAPSLEDSEPEDRKQLRFSASRLAAQRKKLGLSAADMGTLIGVSNQSIYKWEKGLARPRRSQLEALSQMRGMGKRDLALRLEALAAAT